MKKEVIYTSIVLTEESKNFVLRKFKPVHKDIHCHHSTIEFRPKCVKDLNEGIEVSMKVTGILRTKNLDVLLVDNKLSKNKHPHITLSTAEGIKPFQSNAEIENNQDLVKPVNDCWILGEVNAFYKQ
jgi:hypothetical protein